MRANRVEVDFWQIFFEDVKFWQKKMFKILGKSLFLKKIQILLE